MANFVIIVDADAERRTQFVQKITPQIPPVEGLRTSSCASGDFHAVWAAHESAPISQMADAEGAAVIWGEAIPSKGFGRIDARQLRKLWRNPAAHMPEAFDGYHAAMSYRADTGLVVGTDLLGYFPVYHFTTGDVLLVGSSPELFKEHPLFRAELDLQGLVGILMLMHSVGGNTLLRGVRRLGLGHMLVGRPGVIKEIAQFEIPRSDRYFDLPLSAHIELVDRALDEAMMRYVAEGTRHTLMLSGGLDSRMLGGFLKRKGRSDTVLLTLGQPTDAEMYCALPVARELGFEHHTAEPAFDEYPSLAGIHAKWQHGINGFNSILPWADQRVLRTLAPRIITGFDGDLTMGGAHISRAYAPEEMRFSFEALFANVNAWGVPLASLKKLLRPEVFGDLVEETIRHIRTDYEIPGERDSYRAMRFALRNRSRHHIGVVAWALSFGAWPVLPLLDRNLMECLGGIPTASFADRLLQNELVATRFPELAALPLDQNVTEPSPLRPRFRWLLAAHLYRRHIDALRQRLHRCERRYFYRIYDINNPGWIAVRQRAEPYRERVAHLFNMDVLSELLPPPSVPLKLEDGIADASGLKTVLGMLLWSKEYLS